MSSIVTYPIFNKSTLEELAAVSDSLSEIVRKLGYAKTNTRFRSHLKDLLSSYGIELISKSSEFLPSVDLNSILKLSDKEVSSSWLKSKLLKAGLLARKCSMTGCVIEEVWNDKIIYLHLDHVNGNSYDNRIENLRMLCPNCHSQTDTYTGRNSNSTTTSRSSCIRCGEISLSGSYCRACFPMLRDGEHELYQPPKLPTSRELAIEVEASNIARVSRKYSVDRWTIRTRISNHKAGLPDPRQKTIYPPLAGLEKEIAALGISATAAKYLVSEKALSAALASRKKKAGIATVKPLKKHCKCGAPLFRSANECGECHKESRRSKTLYPPLPELIERVSTEGYESVSRELGVSGNAIRKHIGRLNGSYPKTRSRLRAERNPAA